MGFIRAELRAFPRFACSLPSRLLAGELEEDGQVIDVSQGGCKLLPFRLEPLIERGVGAGMTVTLALGVSLIPARVIWATPNLSALGCAFAEPLSETDLQGLILCGG